MVVQTHFRSAVAPTIGLVCKYINTERSRTSVPPQRLQHHIDLVSFKMADSSIIVWDDQPSSPFLTDINDASRHPSHSMPQATDPEIDAIFDNPQTSPIAHKTPMPDL